MIEALRDCLESATAAITEDYFLPPRDGGDSVYRERTYCYELYHQMKAHWPESLRRAQFELGGEVDKTGHPRFAGNPRLRGKKPDLVVHDPGNMDANLVVIEVKPSSVRGKGIQKDLQTLAAFLEDAGYRHGLYLIYGYDEAWMGRMQRVLAKLRGVGTAAPTGDVDLYWHAGEGVRARRLPWPTH